MKRYPKRVNDRRKYQEDELSDEDEYLCKDWQNTEFHGCKRLGKAHSCISIIILFHMWLQWRRKDFLIGGGGGGGGTV